AYPSTRHLDRGNRAPRALPPEPGRDTRTPREARHQSAPPRASPSGTRKHRNSSRPSPRPMPQLPTAAATSEQVDIHDGEPRRRHTVKSPHAVTIQRAQVLLRHAIAHAERRLHDRSRVVGSQVTAVLKLTATRGVVPRVLMNHPQYVPQLVCQRPRDAKGRV